MPVELLRMAGRPVHIGRIEEASPRVITVDNDHYRQEIRERANSVLKLLWICRRIFPGVHQLDSASRIRSCWRTQPLPEN